MDALETLLRPAASLLNRNIAQITPARELCAELNGTIAAIRLRDTALAMYFTVSEHSVDLSAVCDTDPDIVISGSALTLAKLARDGDVAAFRDGSVDLTGDAETANAFQQLLAYAKPDIEEELSAVIGDVPAHQLGEVVRGARRWAKNARTVMGSNIREYLQEESRGLPGRYEVERFKGQVATLRDDVERLAARVDRLNGGHG